MVAGAFAAGVALANCATGVEDSAGSGDADGATLADSSAAPTVDTGPMSLHSPDAAGHGGGHGGIHPDASTDAEPSSFDSGTPPDDAGMTGVDSQPPDDSPSLPDTNAAPDANDGGSGIVCDGLNEWFAGTTDMKVKHYGEEYTCMVSGWCSSSASNDVAAYEPGKGWAWMQAWQDSGPCPTAPVRSP
jgi:hypothetical protein